MREDIKPTPVTDKGSLPTSTCPVCKYEMDEAACVQDERARPKPGDITMCLNCGEPLRFNDILVAKPFESGDLSEITAENKKLLDKARALIKERGPLR